jgi:hypothetical protein
MESGKQQMEREQKARQDKRGAKEESSSRAHGEGRTGQQQRLRLRGSRGCFSCGQTTLPLSISPLASTARLGQGRKASRPDGGTAHAVRAQQGCAARAPWAWPCGVAITRTSATSYNRLSTWPCRRRGLDSRIPARASERLVPRPLSTPSFPCSCACACAGYSRWDYRVAPRTIRRRREESRHEACRRALASCGTDSSPSCSPSPSHTHTLMPHPQHPLPPQHCATCTVRHNCRRPQEAPCSAHPLTIDPARALRRGCSVLVLVPAPPSLSTCGRDRFAARPPLDCNRHVVHGKGSPVAMAQRPNRRPPAAGICTFSSYWPPPGIYFLAISITAQSARSQTQKASTYCTLRSQMK